jgi:hypothetical protein
LVPGKKGDCRGNPSNTFPIVAETRKRLDPREKAEVLNIELFKSPR